MPLAGFLGRERACEYCFRHLACGQEWEQQKVPVLQRGEAFIVYQKGTLKTKVRECCEFTLDAQGEAVAWSDKQDAKASGSFLLSDLAEVVEGQESTLFRKRAKAEKEPLRFTLRFSDGSPELDLEARSEAIRGVWVQALRLFLTIQESETPNAYGERRALEIVQENDVDVVDERAEARDERSAKREALRAKYGSKEERAARLARIKAQSRMRQA